MDTSNKYQILLSQMFTLQLITSDEYNQLKNIEGEFEEELEPFPDYPVVIPTMLAKVSKGIIEDAECGMIPPDYERIISEIFELVEKDTGHPIIKLHYQKKEAAKDLYTLVLKFENSEFKKELKDVGDYYDIDNLFKMINEVLACMELDYRLISLESNDQSFWWVKGNREKIVELFELYGIEDYVDN